MVSKTIAPHSLVLSIGQSLLQHGLSLRGNITGLWAKGDFVSSNYVEPEQKKENLLKPEFIASAGGLLSGLGGMASGAGPIQWALAIIMVGAFATSVYFLMKRMQDQAA